MTTVSQELIERIAEGAQVYLENHDEERLFEQVTHQWADINAGRTQIRPILPEIKQFLKDVVQDVFREITRKYNNLTVVTLTVATGELATYLIQQLGWGDIGAYAIPLEILTAILYNMILKEIEKRT